MYICIYVCMYLNILNFCGMLMKSELQYLSRLNTNECNNDLVKLINNK